MDLIETGSVYHDNTQRFSVWPLAHFRAKLVLSHNIRFACKFSTKLIAVILLYLLKSRAITRTTKIFAFSIMTETPTYFASVPHRFFMLNYHESENNALFCLLILCSTLVIIVWGRFKLRAGVALRVRTDFFRHFSQCLLSF